MVRAEGLGLGYGQRDILSGVCFSYGAGEGPIGLCGPNGSGKSTFLRALLGLVPARSGSLCVFGRSPGRRGFRASLKRMAYLPQQGKQGGLPLTVRELASSGREAMAGPFHPLTREDRIKVERALGRAQLLSLADALVQELSGGQYQRAMIARALAMEPELFLLDEPTTHLDRESRADILSIVEDISAKRDSGVILVSHDPALLRLCPRLFAFESGAGGEVALADRARHVDEERDV